MKRWFNSLLHALRGWRVFFRNERNAKIELAFALLAIALSIGLNLSTWEFCMVIVCIGGVLAAEAFNSAIERLADLYSKEPHAEIRDLKDISAGAVLLIAIAAAAVGLWLFGPKLWALAGF